MEEWKSYRLGDVINVLDYKRVPLSSKERESRKGVYPYYGAQGIIDYINDYIFDGEYLLIAEDGENLKSQKQNIAQIARGKFWVNNHAHIVESNGKSDIRFICYLLNRMDLSGYITGSAQPKLNQANLLAMEVCLPDLATQIRIVGLLSSFDDKIAINNRINHNLEEQAQALYKSWFVDFEPFKDGNFVNSELGLIPAGWHVGTLLDLVEVRYGKDHKSLNDGAIPVYGSGGLMRYAERALFEKESVLIPRKGTLNNVMYVSHPFWTVDTMFYTSEKVAHAIKYAHLFLLTLDLASMNAGSAVPSMTTDILNKLVVLIPPQDVLDAFDVIVSALYSGMDVYLKESSSLSTTRDSLLPKLLSEHDDCAKMTC